MTKVYNTFYTPSKTQTFMEPELTINADFPGGNILLERVAGVEVYLRQDLRDSISGWFYWAFRVCGAAGRKLTFHFTGGDVLGVRGPAISDDDGVLWQWLGDEIVNHENREDVIFSHQFAPHEDEVLLAFCPTYTERNLNEFLASQHGSTHLQKSTLCQSRDGKDVELLRIGNPSAAFKLLFTCRHHCCEAAASYLLEGVLQAMLGGGEVGEWLRANADCVVVPFMDKDGVEAGDQGKNREPHDHNRDYKGEIEDSIYPEVAALRRWVAAWLQPGDSLVALDLHCPHICGNENEDVYFVGGPSPEIWREVQELSRIWESVCDGVIPFESHRNLAFGRKWNTAGNYAAGKSCSRWASELPQARLAAAIEMPYANAGGAEVLPGTCRELGRSLAKALQIYGKEVDVA
jgi:hypothetical protein